MRHRLVAYPWRARSSSDFPLGGRITGVRKTPPDEDPSEFTRTRREEFNEADRMSSGEGANPMLERPTLPLTPYVRPRDRSLSRRCRAPAAKSITDDEGTKRTVRSTNLFIRISHRVDSLRIWQKAQTPRQTSEFIYELRSQLDYVILTQWPPKPFRLSYWIRRSAQTGDIVGTISSSPTCRELCTQIHRRNFSRKSVHPNDADKARILPFPYKVGHLAPGARFLAFPEIRTSARTI